MSLVPTGANTFLIKTSEQPPSQRRSNNVPRVKRVTQQSHAHRESLERIEPNAARVTLPVVRQEAVAQDKPPALVTLQVVGPFKEPSFIRVRAGTLHT